MEALLEGSVVDLLSAANPTETNTQELQACQALQTQPNLAAVSASKMSNPLQAVSDHSPISFGGENHLPINSTGTPPNSSTATSEASHSVEGEMELAPTRPGMRSDGLSYLPERSRGQRGLPPLKELLHLLQEYFDYFNYVIPLYPQDKFMRQVQEHHPKGIHNDPALWAAVCVTLALAFRLRALRAVTTSEDDLIAWDYLRNALEVVPELTLSQNSSLCGITAILGMAIFLQGTPHVQPASVLVATAIRMCSGLGLHRRDTNSQLSAVEIEQRSRIVWIAYLLDRDFCLRLNQPPMPNDDDLDVDPPNEHPSDKLGFVHNLAGTSRINFFYLRVRLAIIQSNIYRELHSAKASKQSVEDRAIGVQALLLMLEEWNGSIPPDFEPENLTRCLPKSAIIHMGRSVRCYVTCGRIWYPPPRCTPCLFSIRSELHFLRIHHPVQSVETATNCTTTLVILHLSYFNCLTTIHGVSYHNSRWTTELILGIEPSPHMVASEEECLEAARTAIGLIKLLPRGDYAWIWLLLYYYVSGIVIILAHILRHPQADSALSDLDLVRPLIILLKDLAAQPSTAKLERVYDFCLDLEDRAKAAIHSTISTVNNMKTTQNTLALAGDLTADDLLDDTVHEWLVSGFDSNGVGRSEGGTDDLENWDLNQYGMEHDFVNNSRLCIEG